MLPPLTHPPIYGFETEAKHYHADPAMRFRFNACRIAGYIPVIALIKNIFAAFYFNIPGVNYTPTDKCRALWLATMTAYNDFLLVSGEEINELDEECEILSSEQNKLLNNLDNEFDILIKERDFLLKKLNKTKNHNLKINSSSTTKISIEESDRKISEEYKKVIMKNKTDEDTNGKNTAPAKLTERELEVVDIHLLNECSKSASENYLILRKKWDDLSSNRETKSAEYKGKIKEIEQRNSTLLSIEIHSIIRFNFEIAGLGILYIIPDLVNTYWKCRSVNYTPPLNVTPINEIV